MSHQHGNVINELFVQSELLGDLDNKILNDDEEDKEKSREVSKNISTLSVKSLVELLASSREQVATVNEVPDMYSWDYVGLYCQYAAVGLLYGASGTLFPFCVYNYNGASNVCSNAKNIVFFAWNIKIFYAILTDCIRPFGLRRKPWMIAGWTLVLLLLLILSIFASSLDVSTWLTLLLLMQAFVMLSDVPADGYSVELGKMESKEQRGQILATGQRIRFSFCIIAGIIQTFLLNGPTTNEAGCAISFSDCWSWGLTINQYYALLLVVVFILCIPIVWLKELDVSHIPRHTFSYFVGELWSTLQNLTTLYLLIFVIGVSSLTAFNYNTNIYLQYYVIQLTNFEAGIDTITTYMALVVAIYIFQKYLINKNWRYTQYFSIALAATLELIWIAPYYNAGGTQNPWFTIFIDLDTNFASGISQVLYSMAVIELAKPGQEATTYELIITVGNAALLVNGIISTQMLTPLKSVGCTDDDCPSDTVNINSPSDFNNSDGPNRFTIYCFVMTSISLVAGMIFVPYLPASKDVCHEWKKLGERLGSSKVRGYVALAMSAITILYGFAAAILLLDTDTACQPAVGGTGC